MSEKRKRTVAVGHGARRFIRTAALSAILASFSLPAWSQQNSADLTEQSLEDLMNREVTSVSKKAEKLSDTASAVFVITQEDIRRSGSRNLPDLLRMVPGADVTQLDANTWAVSVRGLNERTEFATETQLADSG
ncbi:MAG: TonB-dependent receptor plug domain-containing protein [Candidatus Acidiferrales bacterium]